MTKKYDFLITGGCGFVGSAIARYLLKNEYQVLCLDKINQRLNNTSHSGDQLTIIDGDIMNQPLVEECVAACERVIHLAALVGVDEYINRPREVLDVNILGTRNVLEACLKYNRCVVFASTSEVYGKNSTLLHEDAWRMYGPAQNNRWCYAISKSACEQYAYAMAQEGLIFSAVRYFNVYGAELDAPGKGRALSKFIGAVQNNEPLVLVDGGKAVRSLCYIDDAAQATALLAIHLKENSALASQSFNIGRYDPMTMKELAQTVIHLTDHKAGTIDMPGEEFFGPGFEEIDYRIPDVSKLKKAIDFEAKTTAYEGIKKTLEHWKLLSKNKQITAPPKRIIPEIHPIFEPDGALLNKIGYALQTGQVTNEGPVLNSFEEKAAEFLGVNNTVALSNGSDALYIALKILKNHKRRVVLPSYTYRATLNAVIENGLIPVFCDIDPSTFTLSTTHLQGLLATSDDIGYIIPVNVFGVSPDLSTIRSLADRHNAFVVYDCAHGFGATYNGDRAPIEAHIQMFSLHATKTMPAIEGGLIASSDPELIKEIKIARSHGIIKEKPLSWHWGVNSKLDEIRAIVGSHSLKNFEQTLERRISYGEKLTQAIKNSAVSEIFSTQTIPENSTTNYQNFAIVIKNDSQRDDIIKQLNLLGIGCRSYFSPPLHHLDQFQGTSELPFTDNLWNKLITLPLHSKMTNESLNTIIHGLENIQLLEKNLQTS